MAAISRNSEIPVSTGESTPSGVSKMFYVAEGATAKGRAVFALARRRYAVYDHEASRTVARDPRYDLVKKPFNVSTQRFHLDLGLTPLLGEDAASVLICYRIPEPGRWTVYRRCQR